MPKLLDQVIVVDVEATCWVGSPPAGQESEIIEVGICVLDVHSGDRLSKRSLLVKPERSQISEFCTQLTMLTQEQVDQGIAFADACSILHDEYLTKSRAWASYGEYDRNQFEWQCQVRQIKYPFGRKHINVKSLLALAYALPREIGMSGALRLLDLPLEGTHHRGGDDAWNIAGILSTLLLRARGVADPSA